MLRRPALFIEVVERGGCCSCRIGPSCGQEVVQRPTDQTLSWDWWADRSADWGSGSGLLASCRTQSRVPTRCLLRLSGRCARRKTRLRWSEFAISGTITFILHRRCDSIDRIARSSSVTRIAVRS